MNTKQYAIIAGIIIVIGVAAFFGGVKYAKSSKPAENFGNLTAEQRQQFRAGIGGSGNRAGGGLGRTGTPGGQATSGEVINKDDKSITVRLADNSTKIVYYSASTTVGKMTSGSTNDVTNGTQVMVLGTTNAQGIITAQSIQIRPNLPVINSSSTQR